MNSPEDKPKDSRRDNKDLCQYNGCFHPLGAWLPCPKRVEGMLDLEERSCEKCGGQQTRGMFSDPQTIKDIEELFEMLDE